jgi:polysaccharide deacetylase family protein (PEP-CTERM system associated)
MKYKIIIESFFWLPNSNLKKTVKKYAVLSLDVEDWYHINYLSDLSFDKSYSMLDGLNNFLEIVDQYDIKSTLFTLSSIAPTIVDDLTYAIKNNHEVASHGVGHTRPLTLSRKAFIGDLNRSKGDLEDITGSEIVGYRAPCFSLNNELFEELKKIGFYYDSSAINFTKHPYYGNIDLSSFRKKIDNVYQLDAMTEFELPTTRIFGNTIPISGGGYLRIFPWWLMNKLISDYVKKNQTYFLYIHPFELSKKALPKVNDLSLLKNFRFKYGQSSTAIKLIKLISLLKSNEYEFVTFKSLMEIIKKDE